MALPHEPFADVRPWDWWRGAGELWAWGARLHELWLEQLADRPTRLANRQRRIDALLRHARERSRFYRNHWRDVAGASPLSAYPPVTRSELMGHFDDWVTDPQLRLHEIRSFVEDPRRIAEPYLGRYAVWTSSGTTGVPGIYVQDTEALAVYGALLTLDFDFAPPADPWNFVSGSSRLALIAATGGHFAGVVWWERLCRMHPALAAQARVFSILQPLPDLLADLEEWQPVSIASYPTMLVQLAAEKRAGRLDIAPRALLSGGEALTEADRRTIDEAFGCRLVEDYGASECMNIAHGCRCGRLHLNESWVVLEGVDERMRAVPDGEASYTALLTNLANRVQPIVRYDIGDSITIGRGRCDCGSDRPSLQVAGRRDDVLTMRGVGRRQVHVLPLAVETVLEDEAGICRFQLTQTASDRLTLRLEAGDERERALAFDRAQAALLRFLASQGAQPVQLSLDPAPPRANPVSGKLRRICALRPG